MKVQKLGLVLSMNMAAACLMMQGCKTKHVAGGGTPLPPDTTVQASAQGGYVAPAGSQNAVGPTAVTPAAGRDVDSQRQPSGVTVEPGPAISTEIETVQEPVAQPSAQPSKVATVKPLPKPGKPAPAKPAKPAPSASANTAAPTATPAPAAAETGDFVYTVKAGDQLFAVSRRYNVRLSAIEKANPGLNIDRIKIGQKIVIPGVKSAAATSTAAAPAAQKASTTMEASAPIAASITPPAKTTTKGRASSFTPYTGPTKEYKVRSGDTLGKIAYENGITIRALKEMNKLSKDVVRVGQILLIPAEKVVKPVEAKKAAAPAKDAKAAPAKEAKAAPAKDDKAEPPAAEKPAAEEKPVEAPVAEEKPAEKPAAPEQPAAKAPEAEQPAGNTYVVKEGDDIVSVSIQWGISPSQLMDLNGLKAGDSITPGQQLKLPSNAKLTVE